ncbi:EF-hand domain-containing protein [Erythrobacter tepidarius]|uniref:EF-hand domain-containing protein n=1 Tax=Erythrobacter tepidarius TaxID=60454 RepID=UPI000A361BE8|nr:EF-hand domain-containing protein [Erythrobacter tepidarius]
MRQAVAGGLAALALAGVGLFWWQGRAEVEAGAPPPAPTEAMDDPAALPIADPGTMKGPAPPEVSELTREEQRFFRYDRNRDRLISRDEMLSTRTNGFRSLDVDGNNLLTFEEWAVSTVKRFEGADADGDGRLTPREFATTAPKPAAKKPACKC